MATASRSSLPSQGSLEEQAGAPGGVLRAPLLEGGPAPRGVSDRRPRGWIRRAAAWSGPDPGTALMVTYGFALCAFLVDSRVRRLQGSPTDAAVTTAAAAAVQLAEVSPVVDEQSLTHNDPIPGLLFAVTSLVVALVAFQRLSAKFVEGALAKAISGGNGTRRSLGVDVDLGKVRTWNFFTGRFAMRNCVVRCPPEGSEEGAEDTGGCTMMIRGLVAEISLWRLARSRGREVEIGDLRLDNVQATVARKLPPAGAREGTSATSRTGTEHTLVVRKVAVKNIIAFQSGGPCTTVADMEYEDFDRAAGRQGASAVTTLARAVAEEAAASVAAAAGAAREAKA